MSADPDKLRRDLNVLAEAQFNSKRLIRFVKSRELHSCLHGRITLYCHVVIFSNQQDELERSKAANVLAEQRCEVCHHLIESLNGKLTDSLQELVASKERELAEFRSAAEQLVADALERSSQVCLTILS